MDAIAQPNQKKIMTSYDASFLFTFFIRHLMIALQVDVASSFKIFVTIFPAYWWTLPKLLPSNHFGMNFRKFH